MDLTTIGSLAIVGIIISLLVQGIKKYFKGGYTTSLIVLVLSIISGTFYFVFRSNTQLWSNILSILVIANGVYNFILQWFEKPTT